MDIHQLTSARWELLNRIELSPVTRNLLVEMLSDRLGFAPPSMADAEMKPVAPLPANDCPSLFALCLGHGRKGDQGAASVGGMTEEMWHLKAQILERLQVLLEQMGIRSFIVSEYQGNDYASAMRWLAGHLRVSGATAALEFHFNAGGPTAKGHETLYHETSRFGVRLAECVNARWTGNIPGPNRGAKAISGRERGGLFLALTHCPAAILEPFFGSNREQWSHFAANQDAYLEATARGIKDFADFYRTARV